MSGNSDKVKGQVKQAVGDLTADKDMKNEGQAGRSNPGKPAPPQASPAP